MVEPINLYTLLKKDSPKGQQSASFFSLDRPISDAKRASWKCSFILSHSSDLYVQITLINRGLPFYERMTGPYLRRETLGSFPLTGTFQIIKWPPWYAPYSLNYGAINQFITLFAELCKYVYFSLVENRAFMVQWTNDLFHRSYEELRRCPDSFR